MTDSGRYPWVVVNYQDLLCLMDAEDWATVQEAVRRLLPQMWAKIDTETAERLLGAPPGAIGMTAPGSQTDRET